MPSLSSSRPSDSHLLIICDDQSDFALLTSILSHYFPNPTNPSKLLISNKYYEAEVGMGFRTWADVLEFREIGDGEEEEGKKDQKKEEVGKQQQQQEESSKINPMTKPDLMIMLITHPQLPLTTFQPLDTIIQTLNPQEFVLLINTSTPEQQWPHKQTIAQKCNNFIEIVQENLEKVMEGKPKWLRGALLGSEEEEGMDEEGIFCVLDRVETTRWTGMKMGGSNKGGSKLMMEKEENDEEKKDNDEKKEEEEMIEHKATEEKAIDQNKEKKQQQKETQQSEPQTIIQPQPKQPQPSQQQQPTIKQPLSKQQQPPKPLHHHPQSSDQQQQQKALQSQMLAFQRMMTQMMTFKTQAAGMKDEDRKKRAEDLFGKMFKGMMGGEQ